MKKDPLCESLALTTAINTVATLIAAQFPTPEEQAVIAAVLTQIADTIETVAARNLLCEENPE
jgi:hypothetical protein